MLKNEMIPEMVSITEASKRTGLSYELLRQLCIRKEIVHIKSGRKYLINFTALCSFLNHGGLADER